MKNFSVLVNNLGSSQLSFFIIKEINAIPTLRPEIDGMVFYENLSSACLPLNFAAMNMSECWCHSGPIIATSFSTAETMAGFPAEKKVFYIWDLEWMRSNNKKQYEQYRDVYTNESIQLIARSEAHKDSVENAFNRKVNCVIPDFNLNKVLEVI